ncbi:MAG: hypothetical protein EP329_05855 [Deltaproteobacteria bacterium]|nr:MAG: hypothetical protein EP329_05855 [Deltaproteobacteria bacterium]
MIRVRTLQRLALSLVLLLAACGSDPTVEQTDTALPVDTASEDVADVDETDTATPPSTVYARLAETEGDLVGGPVPFGQVGHAFVLGNSRVRFMLQDKGVSTVFNLYGGSLLGADLARAEGDEDASVLRELFPVVDFRIVDPDSVTVIADGSDGEAAIVRVSGALKASKIIDILDMIAGTAPVTVATDYEVRPDEPFLRMRTTIANPTDELVQVGGVGDFMISGKDVTLFAPGVGFGIDGGVGGVDYLASRGDRVSYGYTVLSGAGLTAPVAENSGTFGLLEASLVVPARGEVHVDRLFVVGDGSLTSVIDPMDALLGTRVGELEGVVRDPAGAPVAGVRVTALPVPSSGVPKVARNQARTDADGAWSLHVPPGDYHVIASGGERRPTEPTAVTVTADATQEVPLVLAPPVTLTVEATGDGPQPTMGGFPVLVALRPRGDDVVDARLGDVGRTAGRILAWLGPERGAVQVAPGRYDVAVSHGAEYDVVVYEDLDLTADLTVTPSFTRRVITGDWLSCDFHQHTIGSLDAATRFDDRVRENLAAGLGCFATSEHDNVIDLGPLVRAFGADDAIHSIISDEVSVNGVGHFNAYPLPLDPADPYALTGVKLFADLDIPELFARLRALDGERVLQINHPRDNNLKGYFANLGLDPWAMTTKKGAIPEDWDAIEVNADLGDASDFTPEGWQALRDRDASSLPVLADWFGLLNSGRAVCGVANSDCHDPGDGCGWPRTYLRVGGDPGLMTDDDVVHAVKSQHAVGSRGIWLTVTANGEPRMGIGELVDGASPVSLRVVAEAPAWVPVAQVELYANGLFVESRPAAAAAEGSVVRLDTTFTLSPERDTWYVVVARGIGPSQPVYQGSSFAFTNPVYVDVDGGGFTAPGPVPAPEP